MLGLSAIPFFALVAVVLLTYQRYDSEAVYALALNQGLVVLPIALFTSVVILAAITTLADYEALARGRSGWRRCGGGCYQGILREQAQVRTLRHDLRNHLTVLLGLIESGERYKCSG